MLKLMIVDDERATREKLLENIDWPGLRIEVAGEAKDGAEGLNLYKRLQPDIVLLDVRMPRMNGIECAAEIRKLGSLSKIIFLSGYTEKQYLKSAIHMQAVDYIEKPIDLDNLYAVLKKTVLLCDEESAQKTKQHEINAKIEQNHVWIRQELALDMIRSGADTAAIKRQFESVSTFMPLNDNYRCMVLEFSASRNRGTGSVILQKEKVLEMINRRFENVSQSCVAGVLDGNRAIAILYGKTAELPAVIREAIEGIRRDCGELFPDGPYEVTGGVGKRVRGMENIPLSFELAQKALQRKFVFGCGSVIVEDEDRPETEIRCAEDINQKLRICFQDGDLTSARQEITDLACRLREQADLLRISSIKAELLSIMLYLPLLARENGLASGGEWKDRELQWAEYLNRSTLPETVAFILEKLSLLFEQAGEQRGKSKKIRAAMEHIKEHYSEDLSVVILADRLEMGSSYLSTLFKKETGKTLSEYIETFRMEKAKELLKDERLKMSEVAGAVGYRNANYFTSVFKRRTGGYPSEFRRNYFR